LVLVVGVIVTVSFVEVPLVADALTRPKTPKSFLTCPLLAC
jgi:hypothetical protein